MEPIMLMIQPISVCRHAHSSQICMDWIIYAFLNALTEHIKMIQPEPVWLIALISLSLLPTMIPMSVFSSALLNPTSLQTIKPELVFIIVQLDSLLTRALELVWKAVLLVQIPMHNLCQEFVDLHALHLHTNLILLTNVYNYVPICQ